MIGDSVRMRSSPIGVASVLVLLCVLPACYDHSAYEEWLANGLGSTGSSSSGSGSSDTGVVTITTAGLTDDSGSASGGETASGTASATGPDTDTASGGSESSGPLEPAIISVDLAPNPILFAGVVAVEVRAENTEAVYMQLGDGGDVQELAEVDASIFAGEIAVYSGLETGEQSITLTPWSGDEAGEPMQATYTLGLPEPGSEGLWQTGDIGQGSGEVVGVHVLPSGEVLDFGTSTDGGEPRCYLRRRDAGGSWGVNDLLDVLPGTDCEAIDLEIGDDGRIYLLLRRKSDAGWLWWLAEMENWGASLETRGFGNKDEVAHALAEQSGTLAVCGALPTADPEDLLDAMVRIVRPGKSGQSQSWDYKLGEQGEHQFDEIARGCAFRNDENLVIVGEVFGEHEDDKKRNRRFDLAYSLASNSGEFRVASIDSKTQSVARDVDIDASGRIVITGYRCDDICAPIGQLWWLDVEGHTLSVAEIGMHANPILAPHAIRVSPAGYVVVASGGLADDSSAFLVRAYEPGSEAPLWTYSRTDPNQFSVAQCVEVGEYGEVYPAGFSSFGGVRYPAIATVGG